MRREDFTYHITIAHLKSLLNDEIISKVEFNQLNKMFIAKYHPLVEEM